MSGWHNGTDGSSSPNKKPGTGGASDPSNVNWGVRFDGHQVTITKNGIPTGAPYPAVSGRTGWQSPVYQGLPDTGPIPEGYYNTRIERIQEIGIFDAVVGIAKYGNWRGSIPAWGSERAWLEPIGSTNTYGRSGFSIHGGWTPGSAGCIDLTGKIGELLDELRSLGQNEIVVEVNYGGKISRETISVRDLEDVRNILSSYDKVFTDPVVKADLLGEIGRMTRGPKASLPSKGGHYGGGQNYSDARDGGVRDHFGPGSYHRDGNLQGRGGKSVAPIVLDLNGDGKVDLVSYEQSKSDIDVLGSGFKHHAGWVGPNDGLLAVALSGDGKINKTREWAFARSEEWK